MFTIDARWNLFISMFRPMCYSYIFIQSANIKFVQKHHLNYRIDHSMQTHDI
jgi:hypothetical protein